MPREKKDAKMYFNQALFLSVTCNSDQDKPYSVAKVVNDFKNDKLNFFSDNEKALDEATDIGITDLLNGMLSRYKGAYNLYLYVKSDGKFKRKDNERLKPSDLNAYDLYLSEQANL